MSSSKQFGMSIVKEGKEKTKPITSIGGPAISYLKFNEINKKGKDIYLQVEERMETFDPKMYGRLALFNFQLISNFINIRRANLKTIMNRKIEKFRVFYFQDISIKEVFKSEIKGTFLNFTLKHSDQISSENSDF